MSRLFFEVPPRLRFLLLLLAVLPCVPGLTFLLAGWARDPQNRTPLTQAEYQRATQQSHGLYRAGQAALGMGVLWGAVVGWKVLRRRDETEDETEE